MKIGKLILVFFFLSSVILLRAEVKEEGRSRQLYGPEDLTKFISLVKTAKPPVIDGVMDKDEWRYATSITGLTKVAYIYQSGVHGCICDDPDYERNRKDISYIMIDNMANHQSRFWITYDDNNLYIAHHSPPPPNIKDIPAMIEVMLRKTQTLHDANIDQDDCIDIEIMSPVYPRGDNYIIQVNSIGTTFECIWGGTKGKMPGITVGWDPPVVNASRLTLDGWVIEVAIPWSGLAPYINKPKDGDVLYMNFGRIWREVMDEPHAWQGYDGFRPKGEVAFGGSQGIVVQMKDVGNLPRGEAAFSADITNFYNEDRRVSVEITTNSGEIKEKKEIAIPAGKSTSYNFNGRIKSFDTTIISFVIKDLKANRIVYKSSLPVIRPTEPSFFIRRYRSKELAKIETDMSFMGAADLEKININLKVTNKQTGKDVLNKIYKNLSSYQPVLEFSTNGWEPGDYEATFIFSAPGIKPYQTTISYRHPPLPEWWGNRYGFDDMDNDVVPYPWTDMKVEKDTVYVLNREYRFSDRFLPEQIKTFDYPILRGPIRLVIKKADGEVIDTGALPVKVEWAKVKRTRVEGSRIIELKDINLKNEFWAEYDGFLWNTLTVKPVKETEIVSMELEIPITKEFTDVINNCDYSLRTTGKLKADGYTWPATRPVWLGNGDGGLQLIPFEDNKYFVRDIKKTINVKRTDEGATLSFTIIDTSTKIKSPYNVQFGLIATPVRPNIKRTPYFSKAGITGGGPWYPKGMEFMAAPDPGFDFYGYGTKVGRIYVHPAPLNVSPESLAKDAIGGEDYLFADEFRENPAERTLSHIKTDYRHQQLIDYFVWRHWKFQNKYGFKGLYYDGGFVGYTLGMREMVKRMYNITLSNTLFAGREINIGFHSSGMFNMGVLGFGSYNWDGENYNGIINANQQTYLGVTDTAMYRAQHMGYNLGGWPIMFLGQGRLKREWVEANGGPEAVFDQISGLDLLHDGGSVCCIMPAIGGAKPQEMRRVRERMAKALDKYNFYHWVYQFIPYWRQDIVKVPQENMYVSIYLAQPSRLKERIYPEYVRMYKYLPRYIQAQIVDEIEKERKYLETLEDRAILIVYNESGYEGEVRIKVDWGKLGLGSPDRLKVENAVHSTGFRLEKRKDEKGNEYEEAVFFPRSEEYAKIEGDEVVFPITKYNYRMIVIEKKK
ncbi:MAG: DUF6067 family protein [Candidatus Omnitrophica bacterium]|nr:DUF6067 family protein [Candidatus Omnitrophota bacterium]